MPHFVFRCLAMGVRRSRGTAFAQQPALPALDRFAGCSDPERLSIGMVRLSPVCRRKSHSVEGRQRRGAAHRRLARLLAREPGGQSSGSAGAASTAPATKDSAKPAPSECGRRAKSRIAPQTEGVAMSGRRRQRLIAAVIAAMLLGGCASTAVRENFGSAQEFTRERLGAEVRWLDTDEARREAQAEVDALLAEAAVGRRCGAHRARLQPGLAGDAVRERGGVGQGCAVGPPAQSGLHLRATGAQRRRHPRARDRPHAGDFGARPVPAAVPAARRRLCQQQARLRLTGDVVQAALDARQAWVRAVAAQQSLQYSEQVKRAADASAELARRMQQVGNFSKLQRAREQAFCRRCGGPACARAADRTRRPRGPGSCAGARRCASAGAAVARTPARPAAVAADEAKPARRDRSAPGCAHGARGTRVLGTRAGPDADHQRRQRPAHRGCPQQRNRQAAAEGLTSSKFRCRSSTSATPCAPAPGALHGAAEPHGAAGGERELPRCARATAPIAPRTTWQATTATRSCRCARPSPRRTCFATTAC